MYKKQKSLESFLNFYMEQDELFSRSSVVSIVRSMLEPVANKNAVSLIFTRFKNKENLESLIKRLEYCNNVEMVDVTVPNTLIKDNYVELEFVIFTSPRYNFVLMWDYSADEDKNYTKLFFLANSRKVNDVYEILQTNLNQDYRDKFYLHKPERRENELLNEALFGVLRKLNSATEENSYKDENLFVDLTDESDLDENIRQISHEIKNQLSILDIYTNLIEKQTGKSNHIDILKKTISCIYLQLNNLKNYETDNIKEVVLQDVLLQSVHIFDEIAKQNGNKIQYSEVPYDVHCFADENKLLSVINNVVKNANESTKNDVIEIDLKTDKNFALIQITNHGEMIKEENKKKIFDKNFTTKSNGYGVGLYFCQNYLKSIKGEIVLLTSDKEKTTFQIKLPIN